MITLTNTQAKYIADRLRECYDALKESPRVDRTEIDFALHLILDHPGYQEPKHTDNLTSEAQKKWREVE